ncbi:unnamed protein product [Calicophoron daubneyi]|uniref:WD repeat-containing protein 44 n=1 Tax=Calicophoron daubneyi TaxID=300641 RepID=A0AAV2T416_CALDB
MSSCTVSEFNQGAKAWAECFKSWSLDAARNQTNCPIPNQLQIPFQGERPNQSIFPNGTYPAVLPHMSVPTGVSADSLRNQFTDHLLHLPPSVASGSQLVSTMVQTGDNLPAVGPPSPTFQDSKQKFSDSKLSTRLPESSSGSLNDTKGATLNDSTLRNEQILNPIELRFRSLTASSVYAADGNSQATDLTIQTQPAEDRTNGKVGRFHKYFRDAVSAFKSATRAKIFNPVEESSDEDEEVIGNQGIRLRSSRQARGRREFLQLKLVQEMKNEHTGAIWAMRFSPCGRLLATAGYDRNIRIWVLRQWYPYFKRMQQQTVGAEGNPEFGPTGLIDNAYPAFDGSGGNLMDDENLLDSVSLASTSVSTAGKTDDGASTSSSTQAYLSTKESVVNMSDNRSADQLVSSSLKVPDLERGRRTVFRSQPLLVYRGHEGVVTEVAWSKNLFLLATSMDHQVRLWHISRRECLCLFSHNDTVPTIVFHPKDDRYFLSGSLDGKLRLWNIPDKKVRFWVEVPMPSALPIPAAPGSFTVSNLFKSSPPSTPQVSSISGISRTFVPKTIITCAMFACDGTKVVVGTYDGRVLFFNSELAYITFIAIKSGTAKGRQCRVTAIEIDPTDSNKILVTSNDSRLRLIDARDYHTLCKYRGFVNETSQIRASFSPTGRYLISGSENSFFYIWRKTLDVERISRFSRIRKDRNNCWEAIKAHDTMVTVALFCPNPNMVLDKHLRHCRFPYSLSPGDAQGSSVFRLDALPPNADPRHEMSYLGEVVVSADCNGCIRVFKKYASSESQLGTTGSKSVR